MSLSQPENGRPPASGEPAESPRPGLRAEIESEARELAVDLGDAVDDTREAIRDRVRRDAGRVRRVRDLFRQAGVGFLLGLHLAATAVLTAIVFSESFPYPFMYLAMGLLLWGVYTMRFRALRGGRRAAAFRSAIVNILLTCFWIYVLVDQIPGRPVVTGSVMARPDIVLLWIPIGMYAAAQAGMIIHGVIVRLRIRRGPGPD